MSNAKPSTFRTRDGTEFVVEVTMLTVKRVRQLLGVNVLDILGTGDELGGYVTDDVRLMDVLCAVVRPQLERMGWTDEQFVHGFDQAVLVRAVDCLLDEVASFFQEPRKGLVKKALAKARAMMRARESMEAAEMDRALDALDLSALQQTPTTQGSDLQASSASNRGRSRSASSTKWRRGGSTRTGRRQQTSSQ